MINTLVFFALVFMGLADIYLLLKGERTISGAVHKAFSKKVDLMILGGTIIGIWFVLGGPVMTTVMAGVVLGHLFWQSDE